MKNIKILAIYIIGFALLNVGIGIYIGFKPEILDNEELYISTATTANIVFYVAITLILLIYIRTLLKEHLRDYFRRLGEMIVITIVGLVTIYVFAFFIGILFQVLQVEGQADNQSSIVAMLENSSTTQLVFMLLFITVFAPIVEEIVFRKALYNVIGKLVVNRYNIADNPQKKVSANKVASFVAIVVSSLAFGAVHATDIFLILYASLGTVLGMVYYFSKRNIIAPIVVHMVYNIMSLLLTFFVLPYLY